MSTDNSVSGHTFDTSDHRGQKDRFIYASREEGYDTQNFRGALEADIDLVIDLEGEKGWYRPDLSDEELAKSIPGIHRYAENEGYDTWSISFRERDDQDWRRIVKAVWEGVDAEEELEQEESKAVADGRGKKFDRITYDAATAPVGMNPAEDDLIHW